MNKATAALIVLALSALAAGAQEPCRGFAVLDAGGNPAAGRLLAARPGAKSVAEITFGAGGRVCMDEIPFAEGVLLVESGELRGVFAFPVKGTSVKLSRPAALRGKLKDSGEKPIAAEGEVILEGPLEFLGGGEGLHILRRGWPARVISWSALRGARHLAPEEYKFSLRLWGSGGYLGCWGLFWCRPLGKYWMYATHWGAPALLVETAGRPIVLTPAEPERMLEALKARGVRVGD